MADMSRNLGKLGLMHVRNVSSQITMCSTQKLILDDIFRLDWIFAKKRLSLNKITLKTESVGLD